VPSVCSPDMPPGPFDPRRNLWPLVGGQSLSLLGDYLAFFFALPVFVRDLTGSAAQLGLLAVFETAAVVLFGFIAGVLIDRVRVRRALVAAELVRATALALLAIAVVSDAGRVWMAFAVAFLVGSMGTVVAAVSARATRRPVSAESRWARSPGRWSAGRCTRQHSSCLRRFLG